MSERFRVSTGDIREEYDVLHVIGTFADASFLVPIDFPQATRRAVDNLAVEAQRLGANGVIWIDVKIFEAGGGFIDYATGTAVRVKHES